jgi:hypothetical protein
MDAKRATTSAAATAMMSQVVVGAETVATIARQTPPISRSVA